MSQTDSRRDVTSVVDRETESFIKKDVDLYLSTIHPDMVWVWPPSTTSHDPIDWVMPLGRFDRERWGDYFKSFFAKYELIYNDRNIKRIDITAQNDGAFAVVDVDTRWKSSSGDELHWLGRIGKTYTLKNNRWMMIAQFGPVELTL
tara:strand:- start:383 stop:820 length:438 start_codon:yes stop_codon:yes gene_type:complete